MTLPSRLLLLLAGTVAGLLLLAVPDPVWAQSTTPSIEGRTQINTYARPGAATMVVNVWGSVGQPGLWRVERDVDLVEFLSVVGVPGVGQDNPGTREKNIITLYRVQRGERQEVYRKDVDAILADGAGYPSLQEGDILAITAQKRKTLGFQFFSTVVGTASSLTLLILRLTEV
jgi:hypothetical protein